MGDGVGRGPDIGERHRAQARRRRRAGAGSRRSKGGQQQQRGQSTHGAPLRGVIGVRSDTLTGGTSRAGRLGPPETPATRGKYRDRVPYLQGHARLGAKLAAVQAVSAPRALTPPRRAPRRGSAPGRQGRPPAPPQGGKTPGKPPPPPGGAPPPPRPPP